MISRRLLRKLALDACESNDAWLVLCDAVEESNEHEWLRHAVAVLVFREWQTTPWRASKVSLTETLKRLYPQERIDALNYGRSPFFDLTTRLDSKRLAGFRLR